MTPVARTIRRYAMWPELVGRASGSAASVPAFTEVTVGLPNDIQLGDLILVDVYATYDLNNGSYFTIPSDWTISGQLFSGHFLLSKTAVGSDSLVITTKGFTITAMIWHSMVFRRATTFDYTLSAVNQYYTSAGENQFRRIAHTPVHNDKRYMYICLIGGDAAKITHNIATSWYKDLSYITVPNRGGIASLIRNRVVGAEASDVITGISGGGGYIRPATIAVYNNS